MTHSKINQLFLPLLVAILLSTASKTKIGIPLNNFFFTITYPIHSPISSLRFFTTSKVNYLKNLPQVEKQNRELKILTAHYITENEILKQKITDQKTVNDLTQNFHEILPVRLAGSTGKFTVSSLTPSTKIKIGQPLVTGTVLLGFVSSIAGNTYTITQLDSNKIIPFPLRSSSGPKGFYKYLDQTPQIVDVPSQNPLILGDFLITEPTDVIPSNLLVGKISRLISTSQEPLQKAAISLYDTLENSPDNLAIVLVP